MAHIKVFRDENDVPRLIINGVDFTFETYSDSIRVSSTGNDEHAEVCLKLEIGISQLDIGDHEDVDAALLVGSAFAHMARPASEFEAL